MCVWHRKTLFSVTKKMVPAFCTSHNNPKGWRFPIQHTCHWKHAVISDARLTNGPSPVPIYQVTDYLMTWQQWPVHPPHLTPSSGLDRKYRIHLPSNDLIDHMASISAGRLYTLGI